MPAPKDTILLIGPYPPPFGGQAVLVKNILESRLADSFDIELLNVTHQMPGTLERLRLTILFTMRLLGRLIRPNRIKLLHIHTSAGNPFFEKGLFAMLGKLFGKKVLLHIHGGKFRSFWESSGRLRRFWIRRMLARDDRVIVLSREGRRYFEERVDAGIKVVALPNAVKVEKLDYEKNDSDVTRFLYVGHLKQEKGLLDLLQAIKLLQSETSLTIKVCLMGKGDTSENEARIREAFAVENVPGVEFLGLLSGEEKWRQFAAADVFILPSHGEDMPLALLEAMACGLPVVATDVGAIPELIENGVNGYLVKPHDTISLAEKMKLMAEQKQLRAAIGLTNTKKVAKDFSFGAYELKLGKVYFEIIGANYSS